MTGWLRAGLCDGLCAVQNKFCSSSGTILDDLCNGLGCATGWLCATGFATGVLYTINHVQVQSSPKILNALCKGLCNGLCGTVFLLLLVVRLVGCVRQVV